MTLTYTACRNVNGKEDSAAVKEERDFERFCRVDVYSRKG